MPGYFARTLSTCSGRNLWWTEQCPFQRITLAFFKRSGVRPPLIMYGSHTTISFNGMPKLYPVLRPRCWSGRKRIFSFLANAQLNAPLAFDEVQTTPPRSPQNALMAAVEFI